VVGRAANVRDDCSSIMKMVDIEFLPEYTSPERTG
jgi:hypothetical protein